VCPEQQAAGLFHVLTQPCRQSEQGLASRFSPGALMNLEQFLLPDMHILALGRLCAVMAVLGLALFVGARLLEGQADCISAARALLPLFHFNRLKQAMLGLSRLHHYARRQSVSSAVCPPLAQRQLPGADAFGEYDVNCPHIVPKPAAPPTVAEGPPVERSGKASGPEKPFQTKTRAGFLFRHVNYCRLGFHLYHVPSTLPAVQLAALIGSIPAIRVVPATELARGIARAGQNRPLPPFKHLNLAHERPESRGHYC
jgi:hypothetical protein